MAFKKGDVKPDGSGRKKGVSNKISTDVIKTIQLVAEGELLELQNDLKQMGKFQKWQVIIGVMKYAYSTKKETDVNITNDSKIEFVIRYDNQLPKGKDDNIIDI